MNELLHIERFANGSVDEASEALRQLGQPIAQFLHRYLAPMLSSESDREDVIATTYSRLWERRQSFEVLGLGAWWTYIAKIGYRCALDRVKGPAPIELTCDVPESEINYIDIVASMKNETEILYRAADELWLGADPQLSVEQRKRRLLAAQLFYLHGRSWREICRLIGKGSPLRREELDRWLEDPALLREMAMNHLFIDNDQLAAIMLSPSEPLSMECLDEVVRLAYREKSNDSPLGIPWKEVKVLVLYYRNGLSRDKIAQVMDGWSVTDVDSVLEGTAGRAPFARLAIQLVSVLSRIKEKHGPLREAGLWKRLVFAYYARCELPHHQIFERTSPASNEVGYHLTPGMINVWLSNGRLLKQLMDYLRPARQHV